MQITLVNSRETNNDIHAQFDLTDNATVVYPFSADIPLGVDIQMHLNANVSEYLRLIRGKEYPEAPSQHRQSLPDMEAWILAGAKYIDKHDNATVVYPFSADIPLGVDIQIHLNANVSEYLRLIRGKEYPEAPSEHRQSLPDMEAWITDDPTGEKAQGKKPWKGKHPPIIGLKAQYAAANSVTDKVDIIAQMLELE